MQRKTWARLGEGMSAEERDRQWPWKRGWGRRLVSVEVRAAAVRCLSQAVAHMGRFSL